MKVKQQNSLKKTYLKKSDKPILENIVSYLSQHFKLRNNEYPLVQRIEKNYLILSDGLKGSDNKRLYVGKREDLRDLTKHEVTILSKSKESTRLNIVKKYFGLSIRECEHKVMTLGKTLNMNLSLISGHKEESNNMFYVDLDKWDNDLLKRMIKRFGSVSQGILFEKLDRIDKKLDTLLNI